MKQVRNVAAVIFVMLAAACQGNFGSGPQIPGTIQSSGTGPFGATPAATGSVAPNSVASGAPGETQAFLIADLAKGIACHESAGFSCVLHFNLPAPAPSSSAGAKGLSNASASPSATPTPTPTPSPGPKTSGSPGASTAPSPSAAPAGPTLSLTMTALPTDAPKMVITGKSVLPTTALMRIALVPSEDFTLDGAASAVFTLPKDQIENRGFAIQLFEDTVNKKKKRGYRPLFTLAKSSLSKQKLTFDFTPPKLTLPKGHKYLIVLYGDERTATASPAATGSAKASAAPDSSSSASPTPAARPTPL